MKPFGPPDRVDPREPHIFEESHFFPGQCIHCMKEAKHPHHALCRSTKFTPDDLAFLKSIEDGFYQPWSLRLDV